TAGMKVAISEAARIIRRRGTAAAGRNCSATLWSKATASDLGTGADFRGAIPRRQHAPGADQKSNPTVVPAHAKALLSADTSASLPQPAARPGCVPGVAGPAAGALVSPRSRATRRFGFLS